MSDYERFTNQLRENQVDYDDYDYPFRGGRVINLPYGESKEGLFLSLQIFFNEEGGTRAIDLESD